jgi:hypothetical protein
MGRLFEGFEILCTGYDHMLEKIGDIIQGKTLYKGGHYSWKYGISDVWAFEFHQSVFKKVTRTGLNSLRQKRC